MDYKVGDKSTCKFCDAEIEYVGPHWQHTIVGFHPEHNAPLPVTDEELQLEYKSLTEQYAAETI